MTPTQAQSEALLKLLGDRHVVEWKITPHVLDTNYATFRAVFANGSEARGWLSYHNDTWLAGGAVIPASQAKRIAAMSQEEVQL